MRSRDITRLRADNWLKPSDDDVSMPAPKALKQKKILLGLDTRMGGRIYFFQQ
jgi:hypothetical protein